MGKAILVLEWMPHYCSECPFCYEKYHEGSWCDLLNESAFQWDKLESCPLKELPEKKVRDYPKYNEYIAGYDDGWDACIDEILDDEIGISFGGD